MIEKMMFTSDMTENIKSPFIANYFRALWMVQFLPFGGSPFYFKSGVCSRTSGIQVHLYYMPYKLQRPYSKQGFLSVYARGCNPSSPPPQVKPYGQFSHISTCIILCTSHNWSMTVTSCIRCFSIYFLHRFYAINVI